jgi:PKD repeat protein
MTGGDGEIVFIDDISFDYMSPATFSGTPVSGNTPLTVQFTNTSNTSTGWAWYFGDEKYDGAWVKKTDTAGWAERKEHVSLTLLDGSVLVMGGQNNAGGTKFNDVWRSTDKGANWVEVKENDANGWTARRDFSGVVLSDGSILVMGGQDDTGYCNDVWRSINNGATWVQQTASAEWTPRMTHAGVCLPNGDVIILGGLSSGWVCNNDVWISSNMGVTWTEQTSSAWDKGMWGQCVVVASDGSLVATGGEDEIDFIALGCVWRSTDDGATWTLINASPEWGTRAFHTTVTLPDGTIMLLGGIDVDYNDNNQVWISKDVGYTWSKLTDAQWDSRYNSTSVVLNDGSVLVIGSPYTGLGDNSDAWRLETAGSYLQNPSHTYTTSDNFNVALQVYNAGSYDSELTYQYIDVKPNFNGTPQLGQNPLPVQFIDTSTYENPPIGRAWYFGDEKYDGAWVEQTAGAGWDGRYSHTSSVLSDGSIVIMGGNSDSNRLNDVWISADKGENWTQQKVSDDPYGTPVSWDNRDLHCSVVLLDNSILIMGGVNENSDKLNDVWRSFDKGVTWSLVKPNDGDGWSPRWAFSSVVLPDGTILVMGGMNSSGDAVCDVWKSIDNGETWSEVNPSADWGARFWSSAVVTNGGNVLIIGGLSSYDMNESDYKNDVWMSTDSGATWSLINPSAEWEGRLEHSTNVLPDGTLLVIGGNSYNSSRLDDVWYSNDNGVSWFRCSGNTFPVRNAHSSNVLSDGSVVVIGGSGKYGVYYNDVWRFETAGSYSQNPSHTYTNTGSYNVTLQSYDSTGALFNTKLNYITLNLPTAGFPTFIFNHKRAGLGISTEGGFLPWGQ